MKCLIDVLCVEDMGVERKLGWLFDGRWFVMKDESGEDTLLDSGKPSELKPGEVRLEPHTPSAGGAGSN
jgi:hypothetical protein